MGVRYIFLSEFSGPLHMIGRWTESGTDLGSSASARLCATGRQKPYMHARIHAAQPSGAFRGAKYLRRRTHPHADRTAELGNRRAQGHRPPGQRRRRPRGDRLPGPLQDVHPAVRSHPPSQHGPSRGRRGTERPEIRRRPVPRAGVHPPGRPATTMVNGERLPYRTVAIQAAHDYLATNCTNLNVDADVTLDCKIGQGSVDLRGLYDTQKHLANDTSFGVGFAPFSELETVVLETEHLINGPLKKALKE